MTTGSSAISWSSNQRSLTFRPSWRSTSATSTRVSRSTPPAPSFSRPAATRLCTTPTSSTSARTETCASSTATAASRCPDSTAIHASVTTLTTAPSLGGMLLPTSPLPRQRVAHCAPRPRCTCQSHRCPRSTINTHAVQVQASGKRKTRRAEQVEQPSDAG